MLGAVPGEPAQYMYSVLCKEMANSPYSHKLLTVNNYVNCPSNFAFAHLIYMFYPPIFEKILIRIQSIAPAGWSFSDSEVEIKDSELPWKKQPSQA